MASEINLSLKLLEGNDYYKVIQESSNLEAKLIFPHSISILSASYLYDFKNMFIEISSDIPVAYQNKNGEDFDWQNDVMTFYSSSDDCIDLYEHYYSKLGYRVTKNVSLAIMGSLEHINHTWSNVVQEDISGGTVSSVNGEVLKYEQEKYTFGLSAKYQKHFDEISFFFEPTITYAYHDAIDRHLLRYFYTTQHNEGYEIGVSSGMTYRFTQNIHIFAVYEYQYFSDLDSDMKYYFTATDDWYQTLPSTFVSSKYAISLGITYLF